MAFRSRARQFERKLSQSFLSKLRLEKREEPRRVMRLVTREGEVREVGEDGQSRPLQGGRRHGQVVTRLEAKLGSSLGGPGDGGGEGSLEVDQMFSFL